MTKSLHMHTLFHSEVFHLKLYIQEKSGHMHTYLCSHAYKYIAGKINQHKIKIICIYIILERVSTYIVENIYHESSHSYLWEE